MNDDSITIEKLLSRHVTVFNFLQLPCVASNLFFEISFVKE